MADSGNNIISKVNQSGSGIDLSSLVTTLVEAETSPLQSALTKKVDATNLSISSFGTLSSKMSDLSTNLTTLENTNARTTDSSGSAVSLTVTDETKAQDINANIVVSALAKGQVVTYDLTHANLLNSSSVTAASAIDQGTLTFTKGGTNTTITINSANNTVQGLVDALNAINTALQIVLGAPLLGRDGDYDLFRNAADRLCNLMRRLFAQRDIARSAWAEARGFDFTRRPATMGGAETRRAPSRPRTTAKGSAPVPVPSRARDGLGRA